MVAVRPSPGILLPRRCVSPGQGRRTAGLGEAPSGPLQDNGQALRSVLVAPATERERLGDDHRTGVENGDRLAKVTEGDRHG
jgi:hypothetical protein